MLTVIWRIGYSTWFLILGVLYATGVIEPELRTIAAHTFIGISIILASMRGKD